MRQVSVFLVLLVVTSIALPAKALDLVYGSSHHGGLGGGVEPVFVYEAVPTKPMRLQEGGAYAYSGVATNLSEGVEFDGWSLPLGGGFGLLPNLEVGINSALLLKPWSISSSIPQARLYGRTTLIAETLAAEVALHLPTVTTGTLGVELLVPVRYDLGKLAAYGHGQLLYYGTAFTDVVAFNVAGTGIYKVSDAIFVALDTGLGFTGAKYDDGTLETDWTTSTVIPLGLGGGIMLVNGLAIKAAFTLHDIIGDNAFDARAFQILLIDTSLSI